MSKRSTGSKGDERATWTAGPKPGGEGVTTMALGEESATEPEGEDDTLTTLALGEEQAPPPKKDKGAPPTKKKGEETVTTLALGEESSAGARDGADREAGAGMENPFGRF